MRNAHRIDTLGGLRAVAIMAVLLYHYFAKFADPGDSPALYPYADIYAGFPAVKYGFMGGSTLFRRLRLRDRDDSGAMQHLLS